MYLPHTWQSPQCTDVARSILKTCEHGLKGSDTGITTNNASRQQMGFNSGFKGLIIHILVALVLRVFAVTSFVNIQHFLLNALSLAGIYYVNPYLFHNFLWGYHFFSYVILFYANFSGTQTGSKRRTWCNTYKYNSSMQNLKENFAPVENRTPVVHPVGSNLPH